MTDLIKALEEAEKGSRELDLRLWGVIQNPGRPGKTVATSFDVPFYSTSLDAAPSLGVDLGELRRLAEAAEADNANPNYFEAVRSLQSFNEAANPAVILSLISHIEKLEGRR